MSDNKLNDTEYIIFICQNCNKGMEYCECPACCVDCGQEECECDVKRCITCNYFEPLYKFADIINGEFVITDECKGCYVEDEPDECYGKHCSMTADDTPLKMMLGYNREYCLDKKRFKENWFCSDCEKLNCYIKCPACCDTFTCDQVKEKPQCYPWGSNNGYPYFYCQECVKDITDGVESGRYQEM